jgi:hypothetical protein
MTRKKYDIDSDNFTDDEDNHSHESDEDNLWDSLLEQDFFDSLMDLVAESPLDYKISASDIDDIISNDKIVVRDKKYHLERYQIEYYIKILSLYTKNIVFEKGVIFDTVQNLHYTLKYTNKFYIFKDNKNVIYRILPKNGREIE